jgi:hypothetical protein
MVWISHRGQAGKKLCLIIRVLVNVVVSNSISVRVNIATAQDPRDLPLFSLSSHLYRVVFVILPSTFIGA